MWKFKCWFLRNNKVRSEILWSGRNKSSLVATCWWFQEKYILTMTSTRRKLEVVRTKNNPVLGVSPIEFQTCGASNIDGIRGEFLQTLLTISRKNSSLKWDAWAALEIKFLRTPFSNLWSGLRHQAYGIGICLISHS